MSELVDAWQRGTEAAAPEEHTRGYAQRVRDVSGFVGWCLVLVTLALADHLANKVKMGIRRVRAHV